MKHEFARAGTLNKLSHCWRCGIAKNWPKKPGDDEGCPGERSDVEPPVADKHYAVINTWNGGAGGIVVRFISTQVGVAGQNAASKHIECDMREGMIDAGDVFGSDEGGSLLVWEGRIVVSVTPSSPNGPEEYDAEYVGTFRNPTNEELAAVLRYENPFAES
jgi:hypothetical protein